MGVPWSRAFALFMGCHHSFVVGVPSTTTCFGNGVHRIRRLVASALMLKVWILKNSIASFIRSS